MKEKTLVIIDTELDKVLILPFKEKIGTVEDLLEKMEENGEICSLEGIHWHCFETPIKILNLLPNE